MKRMFIITFLLLSSFSMLLKAQSPQSISYQAVVRDGAGNIIVNQQVKFRFTILKGSQNGEVVFQEIQNTTTNSLGIVNLNIGSGISNIGNLSDIEWGNYTHYLKVDIDPQGNNNFIELGTTQLVSVPYALYANICGNVITYTAGNGIDITNGIITNTSPDQTITLNAGNGINITGTYPNFTITSTATQYSAGNGIEINNGIITNTAPDQTVTINAGPGVSISGTYPNFTVTNTAPDQAITLNAGNGINISGTYPDFTITSTVTEYTAGNGIEINNGIITNTAPDQTVTINSGPGIAVSGTYPVFSIQHTSHSGDITGNSSITVTGIQGSPISSQQPQTNNILLFNGTLWVPVDAISTICNFFNYYYADRDNDGYGDKYSAIFSCSQPEGYVTNNLDNDDRDSTIYPGAPEICDDKDNDQDGIIDPENSINCTLYYYDFDNDGWGIASDFKCLCNSNGFYRATQSGDCNDNDYNTNPQLEEICDGLDNNCNGFIDEGFPDHDNDNLADCIDPDIDNDGILNQNDNCPTVPNSNQLDFDNDSFGDACDTDDDNDGDTDETDCAPYNPLIHHGAIEICNTLDDNCDDTIDNEGAQGCNTYYFDLDNDNYGITENFKCLCSPSGYYRATNAGDCNDLDQNINPGKTESCNNKDDNCNGIIDEEGAQGCNTYYYDNDNDGFGVSGNSKCLCTPYGKYTTSVAGDCNDNDATIYPGALEKCNGKDDNCDGVIDGENAQGCTIYYFNADNDMFGNSNLYKCLCMASGSYNAIYPDDCDDYNQYVYPGAVEKCNGIDDNCNGQIDENCSP